MGDPMHLMAIQDPQDVLADRVRAARQLILRLTPRNIPRRHCDRADDHAGDDHRDADQPSQRSRA
jgi:hypothetical protein